MSCSPQQLEKPFVIIDRYEKEGMFYYMYQDNQGQRIAFEMTTNEYCIGDTLL